MSGATEESARLPASGFRAATPPATRRFAAPDWLREPLLHFVVLGAVLFGIDHVLVERSDDPRTIVVSNTVVLEAKNVFRTSRGRDPDAAELKALTERWVDNEVLYREGLALRVDQGDTMIRDRVIFKSLMLVESGLKLPPVDDNTLRAWFETQRARYDEPARYDFQEAVLSGDTSEPATRAFAQALSAGTPGDAKAGLRVFKGRPHSNLLQSYGADFARALDQSPPGEWRALPTRDGWRVIRLDAVTAPKPATFEALRNVVLADWTDATMAQMRTDAVRARGKKYTVRYEGVNGSMSGGPDAVTRWLTWLRAPLLAGLWVMLLLLPGTAAVAHEMSMAEMELRETSRGEFQWQWAASGSRPASQDLRPVWPETCRAEANTLHCGEASLRGRLSIEGVGQRYSAAIVKVFWIDGPSSVYTLTGSQPAVQLYGSAEDRRGAGEIASAYTVLGIEHILSGIDHLLFVIGLLFLVGFRRRLVWTITAFTAAHSLTLASAALGWLSLRSAPVEACIALSIVLVAGEALRERQTLARRLPALVAFLFGLVHGLGFAGALQDIGLPQQHLVVALLTFNLGVEFGQLLAVGVAWGLVLAVQRLPWAPRLKAPALYAIGSVAAYWTWLRVAAIVL